MRTAKQLTLLSLSASDDLLRKPTSSEVVRRHLEYADEVGHLHVVCYSLLSHGCEAKRLSARLTVYPTRSPRRFSYLRDALRLGGELCSKRSVDLITTQDPFATGLVGAVLRSRFAIPLLVNLHSDFFGSRQWLLQRREHALLYPLGLVVTRLADGIRVVGSPIQSSLVARGVDAGRISVVPLPVSDEIERRSAEPPARSTESMDRIGARVLFVGRLAQEKNIGTLLAAFALVLPAMAGAAELVIVGDGKLRAALERDATNLGISSQVRFAGETDHPHLVDVYRTADVFVMPSAYEGFGMAVLEAQLLGVPCVVSRAIPPELVTDEMTGLVVDKASPSALAAAILKLLRDPSLSAAISQRAWLSARERFARRAQLRRVVKQWVDTANARPRTVVQTAS